MSNPLDKTNSELGAFFAGLSTGAPDSLTLVKYSDLVESRRYYHGQHIRIRAPLHIGDMQSVFSGERRGGAGISNSR